MYKGYEFYYQSQNQEHREDMEEVTLQTNSLADLITNIPIKESLLIFKNNKCIYRIIRHPKRYHVIDIRDIYIYDVSEIVELNNSINLK